MVISSGDLCLVEGTQYNIEVIATKGAKGGSANYELSLDQWDFESYKNDLNNNTITGASTLTIAKTSENAVWNYGSDADSVDFYQVVVNSEGSYTLSANLPTLNGNAIKLSIGTLKNGKFSSLQSVTGKAGSNELEISRNLTAGTYYIKVESNGKNTASRYEVVLTNNNKRPNGVFSNADDTWKQVANNVNAEVYNNKENATISDWVGFGDATDVFALQFSKNGVVTFDWTDSKNPVYGQDALLSKELTLTLVDANGKSVGLTFDKVEGTYTTKTVLLADADYYLTVKNAKPNQNNIDYQIDIKLA
jgi:hypothetical protein